jgi:hypothetical protein
MSDYRDPWSEGGLILAGSLMVMVGAFQALQGVAAIIKSEFFVKLPNYYLTVDVSTWGWIHLVGGALIVVAGFFVFTGALWARTIAIVLAILSAIANFLWLPYYPFWAILIIALDVLVVWSLATYRREAGA